jgi:hypothetical protein
MLTPDTRDRLWMLASRAGFEIAKLDGDGGEHAERFFRSVLEREIRSGRESRRFADTVLARFFSGGAS